MALQNKALEIEKNIVKDEYAPSNILKKRFLHLDEQVHKTESKQKLKIVVNFNAK